MSEQEKYKQMMNEIHVSDTTLRKVMEMDMSKKMLNKKRMMKKMGAVAAALTLCVVASNGICYAATGHSWVTKAIIYINGEKVEQDVVLEEQEDGTVSFEVEAPDGEECAVVQGFVMDGDENIEYDDVSSDGEDMLLGTVVDEDGKQFFKYGEEKLDITEDLADGEASGTIEISGDEYYYEITGQDGNYSVSVSLEK